MAQELSGCEKPNLGTEPGKQASGSSFVDVSSSDASSADAKLLTECVKQAVDLLGPEKSEIRSSTYDAEESRLPTIPIDGLPPTSAESSMQEGSEVFSYTDAESRAYFQNDERRWLKNPWGKIPNIFSSLYDSSKSEDLRRTSELNTFQVGTDTWGSRPEQMHGGRESGGFGWSRYSSSRSLRTAERSRGSIASISRNRFSNRRQPASIGITGKLPRSWDTTFWSRRFASAASKEKPQHRFMYYYTQRQKRVKRSMIKNGSYKNYRH